MYQWFVLLVTVALCVVVGFALYLIAVNKELLTEANALRLERHQLSVENYHLHKDYENLKIMVADLGNSEHSDELTIPMRTGR